VGLAFKAVLYKTEDLCDCVWNDRPEWARPAVGGIALGLLLAIRRCTGSATPYMYKTAAGGYVLWFLILLAFAKIAATSLSIGIGGSGGIFAPSLFIGVTSGMAYDDIVRHLFGAAAGQPALYAVVAMGAVFTSAARAPLTSLASVVEMTGDFSLTLPVMLAVAIASTVSRALSYGTIDTTKLLRRGTDIDKTTPGILRTPTGTPGNRQTSNPPPSHRQGPPVTPARMRGTASSRHGQQFQPRRTAPCSMTPGCPSFWCAARPGASLPGLAAMCSVPRVHRAPASG
jgi:hypothetical protein